MKAKHRRTPRLTVIAPVTVTLDPMTPACPYCGESYDAIAPLLSASGVSDAYAHDDGDGVIWHLHPDCSAPPGAELDMDAVCVWTVAEGD